MSKQNPVLTPLYALLHKEVYGGGQITNYQRSDLIRSVEGFGPVEPTRGEVQHIIKVYREQQAKRLDGPLPLNATTVAKLYGQAGYMPKTTGMVTHSSLTDAEFFDIVTKES